MCGPDMIVILQPAERSETGGGFCERTVRRQRGEQGMKSNTWRGDGRRTAYPRNLVEGGD